MFINPNSASISQKPALKNQKNISFGQLKLGLERQSVDLTFENPEENFKNELGKLFTKIPPTRNSNNLDLLKESYIAVKRWMLMAQNTKEKVSLQVHTSDTFCVPASDDRIIIRPIRKNAQGDDFTQSFPYRQQMRFGIAESVFYPNNVVGADLNQHLDPAMHLKEITHVLNKNLSNPRVPIKELEQAGKDYDEIAKDYPQDLVADTPKNYALIKKRGQRLAEKLLEGVEYSIEK